MNIVVQCAVRGAHQVDQTGLAEGHRAALCKTAPAEGKRKNGGKATERYYPADEGGAGALAAPLRKLTYLCVNPLQLCNWDKIKNQLKSHCC